MAPPILPEPILTLPARALSIRALHPSDSTRLPLIANNWRIAKNMRDTFPHPYYAAHAERFLGIVTDPSQRRRGNVLSVYQSTPAEYDIDTAQGRRDAPLLPGDYAIVQRDATLIGVVGIKFNSDVRRRTCEIGYWLGEEHWSKGIATEVVGSLVDWVWTAFPWIAKLEAHIYGGNEGSERVLEKIGWVKEGRLRATVFKRGELLDLMLWGCLRP